jgi:NAD(P)-dependent dehydrogenase (short-subunit alcohol dehydrogenase family)
VPRVVVADIDATRGKAVAADIAAGWRRSLFVATDVSSVESAGAAADAAMQAFGRLDYLVNNAALFAGMRSIR